MPCCDQCECQSVPRITLWHDGTELLDLLLRERRGEPGRGCVYFAELADPALRIEWSVTDDTLTVITLDEHGHDVLSTSWRSITETYEEDRERWLRNFALLPATVAAGDSDDEIVITLGDWLLHVPPGVSVDPLDATDCPNQPVVTNLGDGVYSVTRSVNCATTVRAGHNWRVWPTNRTSAWFASQWGEPGAWIVSGDDCDPYRRDLYRWVPDDPEADPVVISDTDADVIWIQLELQAVSTRPTSRCCATCPPVTIQIVVGSDQFHNVYSVDKSDPGIILERNTTEGCLWSGEEFVSRYDPYGPDYAAEVAADGNPTIVRVTERVRYLGGVWSVELDVARVRYLWIGEPNHDDWRPEAATLRYVGQYADIDQRTGRTLRDALAFANTPFIEWFESLDHSMFSVVLHALHEVDNTRGLNRPDGGDLIDNRWTGLTHLQQRILTVTASGFPSALCDGCGILNGEHVVDYAVDYSTFRSAYPPVQVGGRSSLLIAGRRLGFMADDCPAQAAIGDEPFVGFSLVETTDSHVVVFVQPDGGGGEIAVESAPERVRRLELQVVVGWCDSEKMRHVYRPSESDVLTWEWGSDSPITWEYSHSLTRIHHTGDTLFDWFEFEWPAFPAQPSPTYPSRTLTSYCDPRDATLVTQLRHATTLTCSQCEPYAGEPPMVWSVTWGPHTVSIPRTGGSRWSREITLDERDLVFRLQREPDTWRLLVIEIEPVALDGDGAPIKRRWPVLAEYVFVAEGLGPDRHAGDAWPATDDDPDPPAFPRWHNDGTPVELPRAWVHADEYSLPESITLAALVSTNPRGTAWHQWSASDREWQADTVATACADDHVPSLLPYSRGSQDGERAATPCVAESSDSGESVWWSPDGLEWRLIVRTCSASLLSSDSPPVAPQRIDDIYRERCYIDGSYIPTGCDYTWNGSDWEPWPSNVCPDGRECQPPEEDGETDGEDRAGECVIVDCGAGVSSWFAARVGLALQWQQTGDSTCPAWCSPQQPTRAPLFEGDSELDVPCACTSAECP
jgi:hypothetical protein